MGIRPRMFCTLAWWEILRCSIPLNDIIQAKDYNTLHEILSPCGRQNDMLVISNASERSHTKRSLIRRVFGAPRPRMTAFTKASSQVPFRTHVRNLNLSFFSVRFFISLRSVQNDMFVISVCEGSHRKRTIWRKMFHFIGARLEWWWGVTAVRDMELSEE